MEILEPFRESLRYTLQEGLSDIREHWQIADIGARSGMSASVEPAHWKIRYVLLAYYESSITSL